MIIMYVCNEQNTVIKPKSQVGGFWMLVNLDYNPDWGYVFKNGW